MNFYYEWFDVKQLVPEISIKRFKHVSMTVFELGPSQFCYILAIFNFFLILSQNFEKFKAATWKFITFSDSMAKITRK